MVMERWKPGWGITPWRPLREIADWERRFEDFFGRPLLPAEETNWMPAIDIFEKDDKFVVKTELPGMKEEDVDVSVVGDALIVKGEKKTEAEVKKEDYYRSERIYGSFYRSIPLPATVDANKIEASFEDGVLEITVPKLGGVKPKKIAVSTRASKKKTSKEGK